MMEFQTASDILSELIQNNIDNPNLKEIIKIRFYWDNEKWSSIVNKFSSDGSVWYVWWLDGVQMYITSLHEVDTD